MKKKASSINAFTMIELLVVVTVIGILVLLAATKVLGYADKAKMANIKHDVKLAESVLSELSVMSGNLPTEWIDVSTSELRELIAELKLYDTAGHTKQIDEGVYKEADKSYLVKHTGTRLGGKFYVNLETFKVYYEDANPSEINGDDLFDREVDEEEISQDKIEVLDYKFPNGLYRNKDIVRGYVKTKGIKSGSYYVETNYHHSKTNELINDNVLFNIKEEEVKTVDFSLLVAPEYLRGFYDFEVLIKDSNDELLASYYIETSINFIGSDWIYYYEEDFIEIDREVMGGIGSLSSDRIEYEYVEDDELMTDYDSITFNVQPGSNESGQMKSILPETYGTYEARIKVPDSKALLNGFFLYGHNEEKDGVEHEVDIEILYYEDKWQVWGTVFNETHDDYIKEEEPGVIFQSKLDLDFDPSEDFHDYKIDFYDDYISFSVDGMEFGRWKNKFDYGDMNLYAGNFYTHWLTQELSEESLDMNVKWVRKRYLK